MRPKTEAWKNSLTHPDTERFNVLLDLSEEETKRVVAMTRMTRHRRGDYIYLPGDPSASIYFLNAGRVKITGLSEEGREVLLDIIGPGGIFGEADALQGSTRTNSAQVLEDALLSEMERKDFEELLAAHPTVSLQVLKRVGSRLKKVEAQLLSLVCKDVPTRLREALANLMDVESTMTLLPFVTIGLTQQDLANLIGASRQETARALKELRDSGVLELRYRSIVVRAPEKLRPDRTGAGLR